MTSGIDFARLPELAGERVGGAVAYANDEFFAEKENLIRSGDPVWREHHYTDRGKWMDGWETRRRRDPGHDFCILRLGLRGVVRGVVVDTRFFRGNYPESCSIEACSAPADRSVADLLSDQTVWESLLPSSPLSGDSENRFEVQSSLAVTHLLLRIVPDGGVARLRVHGDVVPDWSRVGGLGNEIDLAAIESGGRVVSCSDMFFGSPQNMIMPGRARNMSDGWETRRRRGPGHDWAILRLATEGSVARIEIDTNHFKGNYPDRASIEGCTTARIDPPADAAWREIFPETGLQPHTRHFFNLLAPGPLTHLRLTIFPDGGVSRLRVHGRATEPGRRSAVVSHLDTLGRLQLERELRSCCASARWVERMSESRPFVTWNRLVEIAAATWSSLDRSDWIEAFAAHPRIGETRDGARWSSQEQSGTRGASQHTLDALERGNREYEQRFGHLFLVCATGRDADHIVEILSRRMLNDPDTELRVAAEEQRKITELRLEKLVL
ncbi:MAG TPA: allantoicase [Thermoanaerobaculia bacterium]|nr:allantoicase [Thermoanaerobaculia bacterium]